ncbi:hypothetical protein, partial [Sphingobium indicum]|uniref:hypothetical protein n=1 Tax=Sphingobium indicum TaxID=332055 RepID=UPI003F7FEC22
MTAMESQKPARMKRKMLGWRRNRRPYPALCGRQEYCGFRQSIPSSRQASCEAVNDTIPSFADGQTKVSGASG